MGESQAPHADSPVTLPPPPPVAEGLGDRTEPALYSKLVWLTGLRLVIITTLLGATAWLSFGKEGMPDPVEATLYTIIAGVYFLSLISVALLRARKFLRAIAYGQIVCDVVAATGLVYLTGGAESLFTILYPLAIVNAAIGLSRRGAVMGALLSSAAFAALALVSHRQPLPAARLGLTLAANLSAFVLTAALSAYLAEQLRGARRQLAERETELTALSALYQSIVQSIGSGILTTDGRGRITYLNPSAELILRSRGGELQLAPLESKFPPLAKALHGPREGRGEAELVAGDGRIKVVGYACAPLAGQGLSEHAGHVLVFQDLTDLRQLEEAVRRSDRLAAVGKLAAGLAHEIRNPLASMSGSIELLSGSRGLDERERKLMQIVLRESERLEGLVRDFLDFARPNPPQLREVDAAALAEETLTVFKQGSQAAGLHIVGEVSPAVKTRADPAQLKQVLWNLLSNAAEATQPGGRVCLRVRRDAGHASLSVEDSGEGIADADLPRIFDPFFTTKERGTGLGLAIVHRIVEANGGRIRVRSEPGRGSTFTVLLPVPV